MRKYIVVSSKSVRGLDHYIDRLANCGYILKNGMITYTPNDHKLVTIMEYDINSQVNENPDEVKSIMDEMGLLKW